MRGANSLHNRRREYSSVRGVRKTERYRRQTIVRTIWRRGPDCGSGRVGIRPTVTGGGGGAIDGFPVTNSSAATVLAVARAVSCGGGGGRVVFPSPRRRRRRRRRSCLGGRERDRVLPRIPAYRYACGAHASPPPRDVHAEPAAADRTTRPNQTSCGGTRPTPPQCTYHDNLPVQRTLRFHSTDITRTSTI